MAGDREEHIHSGGAQWAAPEAGLPANSTKIRGRLQQTPAPADTRLRHSIELASSGNLAAAEETVRALLSECPDLHAARLHLTRVLLARGLPTEAAAQIEQFLKATQGADQLEAVLLLAEAKLQAGELGAAESAARKALEIAPGNARAMFAVALVCQQTGRSAEAVTLLERGLQVNPGAVHAWVNKGLVEKQMGRFNDAVASFSRALALNPAIAPVHYSLGLIYLLKKSRAEAERSFRKALEFDLRHVHAALQLATLLRYEDKLDQAAEVYRAILKYDPENITARFHLDALETKDGPVRVPADVVRAIYTDESVGRSLEGSLQGHLKYKTPAILEAALRDLHGAEQPVLDVLDLGCGSGLYGALVRARARRLVGVDLSASMIEECRRKRVYDDLRVGDAVDYLAETQDRFDLIVAMDVLCYFGDLLPLVRRCADILKSGGILACSVERAPDDRAWLFHRYGHFLHSAAHLREAAASSGMREVQMTECALRREAGEDRMGFVALFRR
jgi:predicted TPR repeat methyltransferase